jgi:hypothetical protein
MVDFLRGAIEATITKTSDKDAKPVVPLPEPTPVQPARRRGGGLARMTEPCSKARGLFDDELPPFALWDENDEPLFRSVLTKEAELRSGDEYLSASAAFFEKGHVPPMQLDQECEAEALRSGGYENEGDMEAYRLGARMMSEDERKGFFYLKANDRLFRPKAEVLGKTLLERSFMNLREEKIQGKEIFAEPRTLLIAATAS